MAHSISGKVFTGWAQSFLKFQQRSLLFKSDVWVLRSDAEAHSLALLPNQAPSCRGSFQVYNLEQFADQSGVLRVAEHVFSYSSKRIRYASTNALVHNSSFGLAKELALASSEQSFSSKYWDTATAFAVNFGVSVPEAAVHTCGLFNADQTSHSGLFDETTCSPFFPILVGTENAAVVPTLRRFFVRQTLAERKAFLNAWGTASGFATLRITLREDAKGLQVIDAYGCSSHWFNVCETVQPQESLRLVSSLKCSGGRGGLTHN